MTNDPQNGQGDAQGDAPETCPPDGHRWPGQASTVPTPCLCGEKTMSVEYATSRPADDIEGGGE